MSGKLTGFVCAVIPLSAIVFNTLINNCFVGSGVFYARMPGKGDALSHEPFRQKSRLISQGGRT
jgi:hypothetical protein